MRFRERRPVEYDDEDEDEEKPPQEVGLRDRIAHFTW
jgi:hypothetical protein